jgi:hypothetical protein
MKIQQESRPGEYFKESMFLYECIGYSWKIDTLLAWHCTIHKFEVDFSF